MIDGRQGNVICCPTHSMLENHVFFISVATRQATAKEFSFGPLGFLCNNP